MQASVGGGGVGTRGLARANHLAPTLAALALLAVLFLRLAGGLADAPSPLIALLAAAAGAWVGLAAADLLGGVAHWLCDTFGSERTPVVGPLVIAPFREHHVDPQILARKDFVEASSSNAWLANGLLAPWLLLAPEPDDALGLGLGSFMLSLASFVFLTNAFHQWAHRADPPRLARWLWRLRVAIPPEHHARHHQAGDRAYCVTTGWCNARLERWRVFESLERGLSRLR
jgi:ubiquitin-conjugating enzyme E2 variant